MKAIEQNQSQSSIPEINKKFMLAYLPDYLLKDADLSTILHHKKSFFDKEYHAFIYDLIFSININKSIAYIYITLRYENLSPQLLKMITDEAIERIKLWHSQRDDLLAKDKEYIPIIFPIAFKVDKKKKASDKNRA